MPPCARWIRRRMRRHEFREAWSCRLDERPGYHLERMAMESRPFNAWRVLLALVLFSISFGYVEAAVVVYLRPLYEPLQEHFQPGHRPGSLFPPLRLDQLEAAGAQPRLLLNVELAREAATMGMLAAAALAAAHNFRQWIASFVLAFGVWDIAYYLF